MVVSDEQVFITAAPTSTALTTVTLVAVDITKVSIILKFSSCLYKGMLQSEI
jgi:hypothetical protein